MGGIVKQALSNPDTQKQAIEFLSSPDGMKMIKEFAGSEDGKKIIAQAIKALAQGLNLPEGEASQIASIISKFL